MSRRRQRIQRKPGAGGGILSTEFVPCSNEKRRQQIDKNIAAAKEKQRDADARRILGRTAQVIVKPDFYLNQEGQTLDQDLGGLPHAIVFRMSNSGESLGFIAVSGPFNLALAISRYRGYGGDGYISTNNSF